MNAQLEFSQPIGIPSLADRQFVFAHRGLLRCTSLRWMATLLRHSSAPAKGAPTKTTCHKRGLPRRQMATSGTMTTREPRSNDGKGHWQQLLKPSATKSTDVSCTLAGLSEALSEAGEPQPQRSYCGAVGAAGTYVDRATLLRRVFNVNSLQCQRCGGRLRVIATITEARAPDPQLGFAPVLFVA